MHPERAQGPEADGPAINLGRRGSYHTQDIKPWNLDAYAHLKQADERINVYLVDPPIRIELYYQPVNRHASLSMMAEDGSLCLVETDPSAKFVAVLTRDLFAWNPWLRMPPKITRRRFLRRAALAGVPGSFIGGVGGFTLATASLDRERKDAQLLRGADRAEALKRVADDTNPRVIRWAVLGAAAGAAGAVATVEITRRAFFNKLTGRG